MTWEHGVITGNELDSCSNLRVVVDETDRSTIAESETEGCIDGDDNAGSHAHTPAAKSSRKNWADLVDSDEEELSMEIEASSKNETMVASEANSGQEKSSKVCWADLEDSDDDRAQSMSKRALEVRSSCLVGNIKGQRTQQRGGNAKSTKASFTEPNNNRSNGQNVVAGDTAPLKRQRKCKRGGKKAGMEFHEGSNVTGSDSHLRGKGAYRNDGKGSFKGFDKVAAKGFGKGAGKSGSHVDHATMKGGGKGSNGKLQCQFTIGIEEDPKFRVVRRILGRGGEHMKRIAEETDAKLRLRGRGSRFLEGPEQVESTDDLMLCVSGQNSVGFNHAKALVGELLQDIYETYAAFCRERGTVPPVLSIQLHEGYREGSR